MKCPYQKNIDGSFAECTTECPACIYEVKEYTSIEGKKHSYQSYENAIECGMMWREKHEDKVITGCKFVDNLVKPTDQSITNIKNIHNTSTRITHNSIF